MNKLDFIKVVNDLLKNSKKVLVFLRIPNSGNNRHYFFIDNINQLERLIEKGNVSDSITVFKSFNEIYVDKISENAISNLLDKLTINQFNPELIIITDTYEEYKKFGYTNWDSTENKTELKEVLLEYYMGKIVTIVPEIDFCDEENTYHLYVPNKYGVSKPENVY